MVSGLSKASLLVASPNQVSAAIFPDPPGEEITSDPSSKIVILHLQDGVYYELNESGSRVWGLVQQPCYLGTIFDTLVSEYDVDSQRCWEDLLMLLEDMLRRGLLEIKDGSDA